MDKVKFYALVCRNMKAVTRHVKTIAKEDLVIVINSLDEDFVSDASTYCAKNEIEYYITASDGTPSKGKNSVLDLFAES
jgi:ribosomal protein L7Ae-like RNA K-turn-binding protein